MKRFLPILLVSLLTSSIIAMDPNNNNNPPTSQVAQQVYNQLVKDLSKGIINPQLEALDYSNLLGFCHAIKQDPQAKEARTALINWLQTFEAEILAEIMQHAIRQKQIDLAINFYTMVLHQAPNKSLLLDHLANFLHQGITSNKYSTSELSQLIIMFEEDSEIYSLINDEIKKGLRIFENQGGFDNFLNKQEGFQTIDELDQEIKTAIDNVSNNQSEANLQRIQELYLQYEKHPVHGQKLFETIKTLANLQPVTKQQKQKNNLLTLNGIQTTKEVFQKSSTLNDLLQEFPDEANFEFYFECSQEQLTIILQLIQHFQDNKFTEINTILKQAPLTDLFVYCSIVHYLFIPKFLDFMLNNCTERLAYLSQDEFSQLLKSNYLDLLDDVCQKFVIEKLSHCLPISKLIESGTYQTGFCTRALARDDCEKIKPIAIDASCNLAIVVKKKEVIFYDLKTKKTIHEISKQQGVYAAHLSPDKKHKKHLALRCEYQTYIYNISDLKNIHLVSKIDIQYVDAYKTSCCLFVDNDTLLIQDQHHLYIYSIKDNDTLLIQDQHHLYIYSIKIKDQKKMGRSPIFHNWFIPSTNSKKIGVISRILNPTTLESDPYYLDIYNVLPNGNIADDEDMQIPNVETAFLTDMIAYTAKNTHLSAYDITHDNMQPQCIKTIDLTTLVKDIQAILSIRVIGSTIFTLHKNGRLDMWNCKNNLTLEGLQHIKQLGSKVENISIEDGFLVITLIMSKPLDIQKFEFDKTKSLLDRRESSPFDLITTTYSFEQLATNKPLVDILKEIHQQPAQSTDQNQLIISPHNSNYYWQSFGLATFAVLGYFGYKLFFHK